VITLVDFAWFVGLAGLSSWHDKPIGIGWYLGVLVGGQFVLHSVNRLLGGE
jgi:hypothetical protein